MPISGISRVRSASIFRICGINRHVYVPAVAFVPHVADVAVAGVPADAGVSSVAGGLAIASVYAGPGICAGGHILRFNKFISIFDSGHNFFTFFYNTVHMMDDV